MKELFHIHTYRCKHAKDEADELYIKRAVELGAEKITFTDHAPFPGNPFGNRMDMEELTEYVDTLSELRKRYQDIIDVGIGLEIEYLPSFKDYYKWLKESGKLDILILGQHMYELADGGYSFDLKSKENEEYGLAQAMIEGMNTGYFSVLAHPDRIFRRHKEWDENMTKLSLDIINVAMDRKIPLERNLSSMKRKRQYWPQFWELVPDAAEVVVGLDAHGVKELEMVLEY
ncbi:MAG: PHP domain-containing protein [Lachnospira sp.]|nr:PHP domain-containing protein [Lachnospira sp.]